MAYTVINFKTKKALKEAVVKWSGGDGYAIMCYNPGLGGPLDTFTGKLCLEGPHYPKAHTWYAEAELVNGVVVKVK